MDLSLFNAFMINSLLGIKQNMTSTYDSRGRRVGATVVEIAPNLVTQIKTTDGKDGYSQRGGKRDSQGQAKIP